MFVQSSVLQWVTDRWPRAPCTAILESEAADYSAQRSRTIAADATKQDGDHVLEAVEHEGMAGPYFFDGVSAPGAWHHAQCNFRRGLYPSKTNIVCYRGVQA